MKHSLIAIFVLAATAVFAVAPSAQYDFDGKTGLPETALGGKGKVEFVDGVKGQAIKMADNTLTIPCPEGFNGEKGAIAIWIKPVNWDNNTKEFISFLVSENSAAGNRMHLYKYQNPGGLGLTYWYGSLKNDKLKTVVAYRNAKYKKGEWFLFVMTWNKANGLTSLYFNGKRMTGSRSAKEIFFKEMGNFILNPIPFNPANRTNETAFDLVRFYNEPLSTADIEKMYNAEKPQK